MHFARKFSQGPRVQERVKLGYLSVYENTIKKFPQLYLAVQGRAQLEHSSHIVKVGVETTC